MSNKRPLKAYVRYDGSGRAVSSSLIWRKNKPKVGNWKEVQGYECCDNSGGGKYLIPLSLSSNACILSFSSLQVQCSSSSLVEIPLTEPAIQELFELLIGFCQDNTDLETVTRSIVDFLNSQSFPGLSGFSYVSPAVMSVSNVSSTLCPGGQITAVLPIQALLP